MKPLRGLCGSWLLLVVCAGSAHAQQLTANDDSFSVPYGLTLDVEAFGVLENDTLDGENAGESGATAQLISGASHGAVTLGINGSFTYTPGATFEGDDSFVYEASFGAASSQATVSLTACEGGPQIFTCWKEGAFLAKAAALGHPSFAEGFENDAAWGGARSPDTQPSVSSRGFEWRANDFDPTHINPPPAPPPNEITTGTGPAISGQYGVYDREHGYAWGTAVQCDVDNPDAHCLFHDGFTISREAGSGPLFGAGGYFGGTHGANVAIVLDGDWLNPIGGGRISVGNPQFFGVIDAGPAGFTEVQFRETDGKVGQELLIFGDDFTLLAEPAVPVPALGVPGVIGLALLLFLAIALTAVPRRTQPG
jgi:hypothetical protein